MSASTGVGVQILSAHSITSLSVLVITYAYDKGGGAMLELLASFPYTRLRPALILFPFELFGRGPMLKIKRLFDSLNYSMSSHWEVSYWGVTAYAWDRQGCVKPPWAADPSYAYTVGGQRS